MDDQKKSVEGQQAGRSELDWTVEDVRTLRRTMIAIGVSFPVSDEISAEQFLSYTRRAMQWILGPDVRKAPEPQAPAVEGVRETKDAIRKALESALAGVWDGHYSGRGVTVGYAQSVDQEVKAAIKLLDASFSLLKSELADDKVTNALKDACEVLDNIETGFREGGITDVSDETYSHVVEALRSVRAALSLPKPATAPTVPALAWTKEKPKVAGWYWYKPTAKRARLGVGHVWAGLFGELRLYVGEPTRVDDCDGEWAGPIPEPAPAQVPKEKP